MTIKPEERPKLIALVVALIGVVVYVIVVVVPKITNTAAPVTNVDPSPALTAASTATPNGGAAGNGEASATLPDEDSGPVPAAPKRDTFTPPPASSHPPRQAQAPVQLKPVAVPAPLGGIGQPGALAGGSVQSVPLPLPSMELKGVVLGDPAIAVISVNGEVLQLQVGETIAAGLKLAAITDAGISVQDGKKRISVTLGHMMTTTRAVPAMESTGQKP